MKLIAHGAEAKVYEENTIIIKERISKSYRIPEIDRKIIQQRTRKEIKILQKLQQIGVKAPRFIKQEGSKIYMDKIEGSPVKNIINEGNQNELLKNIGIIVSQMHNADVVHGDLTTLNFIVNTEIYVIDFGLSTISRKDEDKAVDLYVFERALRCVHSDSYVQSFYDGYKIFGKPSVITRLEEVRLRGRKREEN